MAGQEKTLGLKAEFCNKLLIAMSIPQVSEELTRDWAREQQAAGASDGIDNKAASTLPYSGAGLTTQTTTNGQGAGTTSSGNSGSDYALAACTRESRRYTNQTSDR